MGCKNLAYYQNESPLKVAYSATKTVKNNAQRFLSVDPLAGEFPWQSPYCAFDGNPIVNIDPDGRAAKPAEGVADVMKEAVNPKQEIKKPDFGLTSPIFDKEGNFLGTDDQGLQGKSIIMDKSNFKQGMKHDEAMSFNLGYEGLKDDAAKKNYTTNWWDLKKRPDYDGKITFSEANEWYRNGGGKPLFVDASKVDLYPVETSSFKQGVGSSIYFNYIFSNNGQTGLVYGTIKLTLKDANGTVVLGSNGVLDIYDFDTQKGRYIRNGLTWLGKQVAGNGTAYKIYNYGTGQVKKSETEQ